MRNDKGYTLIELVVVMAIFIVVLILVSVSFENIIKGAGRQAKSATSQIEGVVGLEMLRTDISHAGFALPWSYQSTPNPAFAEVSSSPEGAGIDAMDFNEANAADPPRAVRGGVTASGSHYLVLKSALLALNSSSTGRWGFVNYTGSGQSYVHSVSDPMGADNVQPGEDKLIFIRSGFSTTGVQTKVLLMKDSTATGFYDELPASYIPTHAAFKPADQSQAVFAYAISGDALRVPYNRADYYVNHDAAKIPSGCNPGTGVLYKAVAGHNGDYTGAGGESLIYPLLNCVGDFQVSLGLVDGNGNMSYAPPDAPSYTGITDPQVVRDRLREVRVYILAHEGRRDPNYQYPDASIYVGEPGLGGRNLTQSNMADAFGAGWRNYRWKVYSIVVQLKNLGGV